MKQQEQKSLETRAPQPPAFPVEHQDTRDATKAYHSPQVFLVGKANRLIAGYSGTTRADGYPAPHQYYYAER